MKKRFLALSALIFFIALSLAPVTARSLSAGEERIAPENQETTPFQLPEDDVLHDPLKPPDTSSPRATFTSFIGNINRVYRLIMTVHEANQKVGGFRTQQAFNRLEDEAEILFERAVVCLDLSRTPVAHRRDIGWEAALELKEVLDRIKLPPLDSIPDLEALTLAREKKNSSALERWRLPETDIIIAEVTEGPRKGEYLFSSETVEHLGEFYAKAQRLPYRKDALVSPGFYHFYNSTPGRLLPPKWSKWLPEWATVMYLHQTLWQWAALFLVVAAGMILSVFVYRWWKKRARGYSPLKRNWGRRAWCFSKRPWSWDSSI